MPQYRTIQILSSFNIQAMELKANFFPKGLLPLSFFPGNMYNIGNSIAAASV